MVVTDPEARIKQAFRVLSLIKYDCMKIGETGERSWLCVGYLIFLGPAELGPAWITSLRVKQALEQAPQPGCPCQG